MGEVVLSVKNLTVKRGSHTIIENVSFEVPRGETFAIIGPNGAGKTTLLKAILGLVPYTGEVEWTKNVKISYVPQRFYVDADLPMTAGEFLKLKVDSEEKIYKILESVGLKSSTSHIEDVKRHILGNRLGDLSGGELQRVMIAWSLLGEPNVLLFDEPTAGVDVAGEETIYSLLEKLKSERKMTIILISHELDIVRKYTSEVMCLNREKVCYGSPSLVLNEETIDKLFGEEMHYYHHKHKK
jgi:zinc transport system ATP-binding protein